MFSKRKFLLFYAAMMVCLLRTASSFGETVVHETVTETPGGTKTTTETTTNTAFAPSADVRVINFVDFDLNKDNIMSINEVGQMLFKFYDTDGNEIIDNNEYEHRAIITTMPMEKNTVVSYDFDGDGRADETKYTYETFVQDTLLTRYDTNKNGLSAHEFTGLDFLEADVNADKAIDLKEWQGSYIASIDKANKEKALLNK